jgi:hypothetical protein
MQLQFQLSLSDYLAAQRLHAKRSFWSRLIRVLTRYIYPAIGLLFLGLSLQLIFDKASNGSVSTMIICGIVLVGCPIYLHFQLRRCYKRTRSGKDGCQLTFGEDRIGIQGQYSKGEMEWKGIRSFRDDKNVFLLYLAPARFIAIPKRVCTDEQIDEIRSLLLRQVKPETN